MLSDAITLYVTLSNYLYHKLIHLIQNLHIHYIPIIMQLEYEIVVLQN